MRAANCQAAATTRMWFTERWRTLVIAFTSVQVFIESMSGPACTYPFSWQDGLLAAERTGDGQTFRRQIVCQAAEAEGVQAGQHLVVESLCLISFWLEDRLNKSLQENVCWLGFFKAHIVLITLSF